MRLIDADRLSEAIYDNVPAPYEDASWAKENCLAEIEAAPTVDAAPVRHGRWLPFHSTAAGDIQYCSACEIGCTWKPNYCPNCGAKMDGGNDG